MQKQNNPLIKPAKFIALDSSLLGYLAKDYFSSDTEKRKDSANFLNCLADNVLIPFLCDHHFHELIKIRDDEIAKDRFNFLRLLPQVAWVPSSNTNYLGSIVDVLAAECQTILQENKLSVFEVRDKTRNSLIRFGTGIDAISPYEEIWEDSHPYRSYLWTQEEKTRETVAIRRAKINDISKKPISSFMNGTIREQDEALALLSQFKVKMTEEIQNHGDKRIINSSEVASRFYDEIADSEDVLYLKKGGLQQFLNYHEIDIEELGKNALMVDLLKLIDFRAKLKVVHKRFNMPWEVFKKSIQPEQIPSWIIESSLFLHSQEQPEYKGSDLNDYWLACLSLYVDLIYVDKRVKNDFERAFKKDSVFCELLNKVKIEKVYRSYKSLQVQIETMVSLW
jgi:hypothetical protein